MIKHVIWDWNGTLLDDIDVSMEALNQLLQQASLPLVTDINEYRKYFQFPVIEYYKKVGFDFTKTPFAELAKNYMKYYQPNSLTCHLHAHVEETLHVLKNDDMHQYILSASDVTFLKQQVAIYDIAPYFDGIYGLDNIHANSKEALARTFVKRQHLHGHETVFIGDSVHDSEVAKAADCHCILIANGHEHKDKLLNTGCFVVDMIQEVPQALDNITDR